MRRTIYMLIIILIVFSCNAQNTANNIWGYSYKEFFDSGILSTKVDLENFDTNLISCAIFHATNRIRDSKGLPLLEFDSLCYKSAKLHTTEMIRGNFVSHENPRKKKIKRLIDRFYYLGGTWDKYRRIGENITYGFALDFAGNKIRFRAVGTDSCLRYYLVTPKGKVIKELNISSYKELVDSIMYNWMHSRKHRKNILHKKFNCFGCYCLLDEKTINKKSKIPMIKATQVFGQVRK